MRLIDADELKEDLKRYFSDGVLDGVSAKLVFNQILHDIDNAPTVDMDERDADAFETGYIKGICEQNPQGEWVTVRKYYEDFLKNIIYECSCSVCGARFPFAQIPETSEECYYHFDYCPSCGAKMRTETD